MSQGRFVQVLTSGNDPRIAAVRCWQPGAFTPAETRAVVAIINRAGADAEMGDRGLVVYGLPQTGTAAVAAALFAVLR